MFCVYISEIYWSIVLYFGMSYLAQNTEMQMRMTIFSYLLRATRNRLLAILGVRIWSHGFQLIECLVYLTCAQVLPRWEWSPCLTATCHTVDWRDLFILAVSIQYHWALDYEWERLLPHARHMCPSSLKSTPEPHAGNGKAKRNQT